MPAQDEAQEQDEAQADQHQVPEQEEGSDDSMRLESLPGLLGSARRSVDNVQATGMTPFH